MKILYTYNKLLKKIRGSAIKNSVVHITSKIESGTAFINSSIGKHSSIGYDRSFNNVEVDYYCSIANKVTIGYVAHLIHFVSNPPVFLSYKHTVKTRFAEYIYLHENKIYIRNGMRIGCDSIY